MAVVTNKSGSTEEAVSVLERLIHPKAEDGLPKPPLLLSAIILSVATIALVAYRYYMEATSFTVGLDYFEPEFELYWMNMLYVQGIVIPLLGAIGLPLVWFTRPAQDEVLAMAPERELSYYILIFTIVAASSILVVCVLGIWVEADAAWHQVTIRDTDFTPTHIQLFYGLIPIAAVGIVLGLVWLHTNMPDYVNRVSVPLVIMAAAPLLIMPNLGYNEWGHTFFYAEELFAAPVHYGFVVLGWGLFAVGGFLLECINRILVLTDLKEVEA